MRSSLNDHMIHFLNKGKLFQGHGQLSELFLVKVVIHALTVRSIEKRGVY